MRDEEQVLADLGRWTREDLLAYATEQHRLEMDAFPGVKDFPELADWDQYLDEHPPRLCRRGPHRCAGGASAGTTS